MLLDLRGAVNAALPLRRVELALDGAVEEEVRLNLLFVGHGAVAQRLHEGLRLRGEMLAAVNCARGRHFEAGVEVGALCVRRRTRSLRFGASFGCFRGGGATSVLFSTSAA